MVDLEMTISVNMQVQLEFYTDWMQEKQVQTQWTSSLSLPVNLPENFGAFKKNTSLMDHSSLKLTYQRTRIRHIKIFFPWQHQIKERQLLDAIKTYLSPKWPSLNALRQTHAMPWKQSWWPVSSSRYCRRGSPGRAWIEARPAVYCHALSLCWASPTLRAQ